MYSFFALVNRLKHVRRWSLMPGTRAENVMEHSYQVALIVHALASLHNRTEAESVDAAKLSLVALFHDVAEVFTGDLPTPIKYASREMERAFAAITEQAQTTLLRALPQEERDLYEPLVKPQLSPTEQALLKAADRIAALIHCQEELNQGNQEFKSAYQGIQERLEEAPQAARTFIAQYLGSFGDPLDGLTKGLARD
jgi:5'-deoxynucleotidase